MSLLNTLKNLRSYIKQWNTINWVTNISEQILFEQAGLEYRIKKENRLATPARDFCHIFEQHGKEKFVGKNNQILPEKLVANLHEYHGANPNASVDYQLYGNDAPVVIAIATWPSKKFSNNSTYKNFGYRKEAMITEIKLDFSNNFTKIWFLSVRVVITIMPACNKPKCYIVQNWRWNFKAKLEFQSKVVYI